jgi:hypothetical protein
LDTDSDTPKLLFSPVRHITQVEWEVAKEAGESAEAKNAVTMTVAQTDGVKKPLALPGTPVEEFEKSAPKAKAKVIEAEDAEIAEPTKRVTKKPDEAPAPKKDLASVISAWSDA